jgi:FkbM family methyltransferase
MVINGKSFLHGLLRHFGMDIVRWYKVPENTLLGLAEHDIHTVLDIGANIGQSARFYRQIFPNALIYSFEPLQAAYVKLDEWAQKQNGKVIALNIALGDHNGAMTIKEHVDFSPSSSFLKSTRHSTSLFPFISRQQDTQVTMTRLDDVAKDLDIKPGILVKMDVQGFEDRVIKGGKAVLNQADTCIMEVCLQPLYEGQPTFMDICLLMDGLGFEYAGNIQQTYDDKGRVIYLDAIFKKPVIF